MTARASIMLAVAALIAACQTSGPQPAQSATTTAPRPAEDCGFDRIPGTTYRLAETQRPYVTNMFFFDASKEKVYQLNKAAYQSLVSAEFKIAQVGVVTAEDTKARAEYLARFRYFQEEYDGKLFKRDKAYSTKVVTRDCSVFYLTGATVKVSLASGIVNGDGSRLSDTQLIQVIGPQALAPLELTAKIEYDKFEKRFKVSTPQYNNLLLRGSVDEAGRLAFAQLYADLVFLGSWGFVRNALDTDGKSHDVTKISTNTDCSSRVLGCVLTETVGISVDRAFLESKRAGFEIKAFGTKDAILKVPAQVIEAFLQGIDAARTRGPGGG